MFEPCKSLDMDAWEVGSEVVHIACFATIKGFSLRSLPTN